MKKNFYKVFTKKSWKSGKNLIWAVTVADTLCQSYVNQCSKLAGAAADLREDNKNSKYKELAENYCFVPVGIETLGAWGTEGHKLVKQIGEKVAEETGEKKSNIIPVSTNFYCHTKRQFKLHFRNSPTFKGLGRSL